MVRASKEKLLGNMDDEKKDLLKKVQNDGQEI